MSNDSEIRTTLNSQRKHEQMYSLLHHVAPDLAKAEGIPRSPEPPSTVLAKTKIPLRALAKPSSFPGIGFFLRYTMSAYQHTAKIHVLLYIYIIMYIHRQRHKDWTRLNYSCIVFEYGIQIVPFHKVLRQFGRFKNASGSWTSRSYWKSHLVSRIHAEICEFDANTHNKNWSWSYPLLSFQDVQLDWKSLWQRHAGSE